MNEFTPLMHKFIQILNNKHDNWLTVSIIAANDGELLTACIQSCEESRLFYCVGDGCVGDKLEFFVCDGDWIVGDWTLLQTLTHLNNVVCACNWREIEYIQCHMCGLFYAWHFVVLASTFFLNTVTFTLFILHQQFTNIPIHSIALLAGRTAAILLRI